MSTCARCGLPDERDPLGDCSGKGALACRTRELSNLHSLLRSVTGHLEEAADDLASRNDDRLLHPLALVNGVLELLS